MRRTLQTIVECPSIKIFNANNTTRLWSYRGYKTERKIKQRENKPLHPYKNLHPWRSVDKFSEHLTNNVIYNQDGVVVLNKPYGISNSPLQTTSRRNPEWNSAIGIANSIDYTLSDVLPNISKRLGYESLSIVKSPERHISGIAILANDNEKANAVKKSLARAQCGQKFPRTYWIVTTRLPKCNGGELNLAITKRESPCKSYKQPIMLTSWKENEVKRGEVKKFSVSYRTISKAAANLAALMEMKCTTTKWHAIRVFASTVLVSPILGDRIHGSRVQKVMGTYLNISPFVDAARQLPILHQTLLEKLNLTSEQRVIIPTHIHLREIILTSFSSRGKDLKLVAPLPPSFQWTCDQLEFQIPNENEEIPLQLRIAASQ